jgi:alpha-D-xyloside xylohydrolase
MALGVMNRIPQLSIQRIIMKRITQTITLLSLFLLPSLAPAENNEDAIESYTQQSTGFIARSDDEWIKLQVVSDEIIRVTTTPAGEFPEDSSFMVVEKAGKFSDWTLDDTDDELGLNTGKIRGILDKNTGQIRFCNAAGETLLSEVPKGRNYTPAEVMGEQTYHVQQQFDGTKDKAIYGFGGHQNGIMNFKGKDVLMMQYNVIDVDTFMISDRNYGILWDNDSITTFGDERDYQPLSILKLYDAEGNPGALTATYFKKPDFTDTQTVRRENHVTYEFLESMARAPEGFDFKGSIRWEGSIESTVSGVHKFMTYGSSYTKIWLDDVLVVDKWRQNWMPWTNLFELKMEPGEKHKLVMEWSCNEGYATLECLTPEPADLDNKLVWTSEVGEQIDYYFVYGESPDAIVANYRKLTGEAPMMPKWSLGKWQCRERYQTQEELLNVVREFRKRRVPLDNIVLDWRYWTDPTWGSHEFDKERFPDPDGMIKELHEELNTHIMISVWPKFNKGIDNYNKFEEKGWLYMENIRQKVKDWVGEGYHSTFYDAFNPGARELFWNLMDKNLFSKGIDAWWLDAVEPDMHSNISLEDRKKRMNPTAAGTGARVFNAYSIEHSKGVYEGQIKSAPDQRVFILTRSSYAGQQRYSAATWSGDVASRWLDFKNQIPAGMNFSISGIPYWTTDIGGFSVEPRYENATGEDLEEFRELMVRWYQFGAFCPLFRVHGQFPYREFYEVAPENHPVYQSMVKYDKLRYNLMPYIYSLSGKVTQEGHTIMRPLYMDFRHDEQVLDIADQYMYGPMFLVCPVTDYKARNRAVYLPADTMWYDFHTGVQYTGGQRIVSNAPVTDMPLYIKAGSILPLGPDIQYTDEKAADPIELRIYAGQDGSFTLYEDEGTNNNYLKGKFSEIPFKWNDKDRTLTIGDRKGEYEGMLKSRTFNIVRVNELNGYGAGLSTHFDKTVKYHGVAMKVQL